jgi:hypothetical protein
MVGRGHCNTTPREFTSSPVKSPLNIPLFHSSHVRPAESGLARSSPSRPGSSTVVLRVLHPINESPNSQRTPRSFYCPRSTLYSTSGPEASPHRSGSPQTPGTAPWRLPKRLGDFCAGTAAVLWLRCRIARLPSSALATAQSKIECRLQVESQIWLSNDGCLGVGRPFRRCLCAAVPCPSRAARMWQVAFGRPFREITDNGSSITLDNISSPNEPSSSCGLSIVLQENDMA